MPLSRRSVVVCGVGLLFGYTLTQIIISKLYTRSHTGGVNGRNYFVPPGPHSHGEMDRYMPEFSAVQQWHDFDENSHLSMYAFMFYSKLVFRQVAISHNISTCTWIVILVSDFNIAISRLNLGL